MDSGPRRAEFAPAVRLTLPATLAPLVSDDRLGEAGRSRSVALGPGSWRDVAREIAERFPRLAAFLLDDSGGVAPSFALVLGDEIVPDVRSLHLRAGDRIFLIPTMAGG